jgi:chromosome segregation ATPase
MKTKLVLWGNDKDDKKILITLELLSTENQVVLNVIPENTATEELYAQLMDQWREGEAITFPENMTTQTQELTLAETLLPEDIKVEKTDIITKAQAEWHFVVLSEKLYASYLSEIDMMKEKIAAATVFEKEMWEDLKGLQEKVQSQFKDRNIQREHIGELRTKINEVFDLLKQLRAAQDAQFRDVSDKNYEKITSRLGVIENKISENAKFSIVFDELKALQRDLKTIKLVREQRNELWERIDNTFKAVKEKRFGPQKEAATTSSSSTGTDRVKNRYDGLMSALSRMETSIKRDREELNEQLDKIKHSRFEGVLEQQISQAKVNMIENRITSKEAKLKDMHDTRNELEAKIKNIKEKEDRRIQKEAEEKAKAVAEAAEKAKAIVEKKSTVVEVVEAATEVIAETVVTPVAEVVETVTEVVAEKVVTPVSEVVKAVKETIKEATTAQEASEDDDIKASEEE